MGQTKTQFSFARSAAEENGASTGLTERVARLLPACAHYAKSDRPMYLAGYRELCRVDLTGKRALEVCCGYGELTRQLAGVFPGGEVIGMDRYPDAGAAIVEAQKGGAKNVRYTCGDAMRLTEFGDASLDLVFGQATLHHLAHDVCAVGREYSRVLKPGGRLVFISEPLGHNPFFAMIRAYRIARIGMADESNVIISQLDEIAQSFSKSELQAFNLFGYPFKGVGRLGGESLMAFIDRIDVALMRGRPGLARMAANFNVIFTK